MKQIYHFGDRQFEIESVGPLSEQQALQILDNRSNCGRCTSGMMKLGTASCGGPYVRGSTHTFTASIVSGGTPPYTYTWKITQPSGSVVTLIGLSQQFQFTQEGIYGISMTVVDSCASGGLSDTSNCSVTVNAPCLNPVCTIQIS